MASYQFSYRRGTIPQVPILLQTSLGGKRVVGEIDSGSHKSLCPLAILGELGLSLGDLEEVPEGGEAAVGGTFPTWSARGTGITGQILAPNADRTDFEPWGSMFSLGHLSFADTTTLLLGQADFFAAFDLHFLNRAGTPTVEISELPGPVQGP